MANWYVVPAMVWNTTRFVYNPLPTLLPGTCVSPPSDEPVKIASPGNVS